MSERVEECLRLWREWRTAMPTVYGTMFDAFAEAFDALCPTEKPVATKWLEACRYEPPTEG